MFSIVSSNIIEDKAQIDGRRHICEVHTDSGGKTHEFRYMTEAGQDVETIMSNRAEWLANTILRSYEDREISNGIYSS